MRKVLDEFIVPKPKNKAFILKKGQVMRVIQIGGGQCVDIRFFNEHNYKEQFAALHSLMINTREGIPHAYYKTKKLYSKMPWERLMLTVIEDTVGVNTMGGCCSPKSMEVRGLKGHWSCGDNFRECLEPCGIKLEDMDSAGVITVWMAREIDEEGNVSYPESPAKDGDHIDFLAEMDVLVGISICPGPPPLNVEGNRDLKIQILE